MPVSKKLDSPFHFFYVERLVVQPALMAGTPDIKKLAPVGEYHIVHRGRLMCGESREVIKNREKGHPKEAKERPRGIKCCALCDEKWRANPDSPYFIFVNGKDIPPTEVGDESKVRK